MSNLKNEIELPPLYDSLHSSIILQACEVGSMSTKAENACMGLNNVTKRTRAVLLQLNMGARKYYMQGETSILIVLTAKLRKKVFSFPRF